MWTFKKLNELQFRNGKIEHFEFVNEDQNIITCSNLGIICLWNIYTGEKLCEYIEKTVQFKRVLTHSTQSKLFIVAIDRLSNIRLLTIKIKNNSGLLDSNSIGEFVLEEKLNCSMLNCNNASSYCVYRNWLISGNQCGDILIYNYLTRSLHNNRGIETIPAYHNESICQVRVSASLNKINLITCSDDGQIKLSILNELLAENVPSIAQIDDILLTKSEINKLIKQELTLKNTLVDKKDEQVYQLRLKEILHKEQTRTQNYESKLSLTSMRTLLAELKASEQKWSKQFTSKIEAIKGQFKHDSNLIRESCEMEMCRLIRFHQHLTQQFEELSNKNVTLNDRFEAIKVDTQNSFRDHAENEKCLLSQQIEADKKIYLNKIKVMREANRLMEIEDDKFIHDLKAKSRREIELMDQVYDADSHESLILQKKIAIIRSELKAIRETDASHEETLLTKKKKFLTKSQANETMIKIARAKQSALSHKQKQIQQLKNEIERLGKIRFINSHLISELSNKIQPIENKNSKLKERMSNYEIKLATNIFGKINNLKTAKSLNFLSATKIESKILQVKRRLQLASRFHETLKSIVYDLACLNDRPGQLIDLLVNINAVKLNRILCDQQNFLNLSRIK